MRVQAVRQGFYDQVLRDPGEVFDLLDDAEGNMPIRMKQIDLKDDKGQLTGEYVDEPWLDDEGNAVHADFAPADVELRGKGKFRGEMFSPGWMVQVPDETPLGIYPPETKFAMSGESKPIPIKRIISAADQPLNMPRMTPMRGKRDRPHRAGP